MDDKATPRPWCEVETEHWTLGIASLGAMKIVASVPAGSNTGKEDRALIVRAVNAHEALVTALEDQIELWEMAKPILDLADAREHKVKFTEMFDPIGCLRAALTLAKGDADG